MSEKLKKEVDDFVLKLKSKKMKRYQKTATNADELIGFIMDDDGKIDGSYIIDQLVGYGLNFQVECVLIFDCDNMENVIHLGRTTNLTVKFLCDATKRHNAVKDYVKFYGNPTHIAEVDYDVRNADYEFFISEGQIKKWGKGEY
jgi:hypothetical protein